MHSEIHSPYVFPSSDPFLAHPDASRSHPISPQPLPPCDDIREKSLAGLGLFNAHLFGTPIYPVDPFYPRSFPDSDDSSSPLSLSEVSSSPAALFLSSFSPNIDAPVVLPD